MSVFTKERIEDFEQQCLNLISSQRLETEKAIQRLEGAAEGVRFLANSLLGRWQPKKEEGEENGKGDKPVSPLTKV